MKTYRVFDHTADLGIDVSGKTLADLYGNAALALFDIMVEPAGMQVVENREIEIHGADPTDLFVNFLREMLYLFNGEGLVLTSCRVAHIDERSLSAHIRCGRYDARTHRVKTEIKAVTYHQATVMKTARGWQGRVIFDV
jgi:SHS2 domain-containing protein